MKYPLNCTKDHLVAHREYYTFQTPAVARLTTVGFAVKSCQKKLIGLKKTMQQKNLVDSLSLLPIPLANRVVFIGSAEKCLNGYLKL